MHDHQRCRPWRDFLASLHPSTLDRMDALASPDLHYHDPFIDVRGREMVKRAFGMVFLQIEAPRFTFTHCACDGDICFLRWHFTCRPKTIGQGLPWICDGITELRFDSQGRVLEHVEHWDSGEQVYEKLPVVRFFIRLIKRRVSGWRG